MGPMLGEFNLDCKFMVILKDFPKMIVPCLGWQNHGSGRNPVTVSTWDVENPGKHHGIFTGCENQMFTISAD